MNFKIWIEEDEGSLGASSPEMAPPMVNKDANAPASDEVKRTGLQPQVDAQSDMGNGEDDSILSIDSEIEHMDNNIKSSDGEVVNQFKQMWDQLKQQWEKIKMSKESPQDTLTPSDGFGDAADPKYSQTMQQHPNMVPAAGQGPHGPGIFGQS